ncbi:MAG: hypothetical protein R2883_01970 [Caldisericia bacterium]
MCIRSSGYFNRKAEKLLRLSNHVLENYGSIEKMLEEKPSELEKSF